MSHEEARLPTSFVVVLGALSGFAPLSIDMYLPGLPALERTFHTSASLAQVTLTACLLGLAVAQVVIGPLSDRFGRRGPLLVGVAAYAAASIACALAPDLWLFVVLRFVQGAAGAAGIVISRAVVRDLTSGAKAVRLFALLQVVNGFFPALSPVIGAQLLRVGSWRLAFVVLASLGGGILLATLRMIPETLGRDHRASGGARELIATFATLFGDGRFLGYALVSGFVFGAMFSYISGSPFVLENIYGLSPQLFSAVFATNAAGIVLASQFASRWSRRVGPGRILGVGVVCSGVGGAGLLFSVGFGAGLPGVLPSLFLVVSAVGVVMPAATALAMADYPQAAGSASGLLGVLQFLIGAGCAPLVGAFGSHTAVPMSVVIAALGTAALALAGVLARIAPPNSADTVQVVAGRA